MYNINEISQVTGNYIFIHRADGTQDRKSINIAALKTLYNEILEMLQKLDFVENYNLSIYEKNCKEIKRLDRRILQLKDFIAENQNDPMIRRGLHSVCFELEAVEKEWYILSLKSAGVTEAKEKANSDYRKFYKLKEQIESVLNRYR